MKRDWPPAFWMIFARASPRSAFGHGAAEHAGRADDCRHFAAQVE
jgi:hypothetical protein